MTSKSTSSTKIDYADAPEFFLDCDSMIPAPVDVLLGIKYISCSNKMVRAEMLIQEHHAQPMGILHGGISVVIAESVGSVASNVVNTHFQGPGTAMVGLDINANHCKSAMIGDTVVAIATPLHLGKSSHVWEIKITSKEHDYLICVSRLTTHVMKLDPTKHKQEFIQNKPTSPTLPTLPTPKQAQPIPTAFKAIQTSPVVTNIFPVPTTPLLNFSSVATLSSLQKGERIPMPACL